MGVRAEGVAERAGGTVERWNSVAVGWCGGVAVGHGWRRELDLS
jgi:hypothetical protein